MRKVTVFASIFCVAAVLMVVGAAPTQAADLDPRLADPATHWVNERGSTMTLVFTCNGSQNAVCTLSGNYINNAQGFQCRGNPYPLVGVYYINTQTLSWSVAWSNAVADCGSVTGWTGYLIFSSPIQIVTNWNLAYSTGGTGRAIMQGADTFTQRPTMVYESLLKGGSE